MRASYDVAIAGGGIVGAACAAACAAAGLSVAVVEPGPIGGGATAAGMGVLARTDRLGLAHGEQRDLAVLGGQVERQ